MTIRKDVNVKKQPPGSQNTTGGGGVGGGGEKIKNVNLKVKLKVCFSDTHKCHYSLAQEQA